MRIKKVIPVIMAVLILVAAGAWYMKARQKVDSAQEVKMIQPRRGAIRTLISCTGTVLPKNRLEVKPPVNGRIESIQVKEGQVVKTGQTLAWMSSTDRAALLDAARGQSQDKLKYWQDIYKPIALLAPIDGEVIVARTQPGQTMTTSDAVVVLSDNLIVRAQVDEIDIGKIIVGMKAIVTLDAYSDKKIAANVEHIYYESQTVNNVTVYLVDLLPEEVPDFFRSGMNASVDFIQNDKKDVLLLPVEVVQKDNGDTYVLLAQPEGREPVRTRVILGISDDKNVEVISGVTENDSVIQKTSKYVLPKSQATGTNPFMPQRQRRR